MYISPRPKESIYHLYHLSNSYKGYIILCIVLYIVLNLFLTKSVSCPVVFCKLFWRANNLNGKIFYFLHIYQQEMFHQLSLYSFFFIYEKNNGNFRISVLDINKSINLFTYLLAKDTLLSFLSLIFPDRASLGESIL